MDKPIQPLPSPPHATEPGRSILLPEELMMLVWNHEHHQCHLHHWRSLRFLAYHPGLSQLMQALADESRYRLSALTEALAGLSLEAPAATLSAWTCKQRMPHFFIVDHDMARLELTRVLLEESRTRRFYERLLKENTVPGLDALLEAYIAQSRGQCELLEETRGRLPSGHRPLGSVARTRRCRRHLDE